VGPSEIRACGKLLLGIDSNQSPQPQFGTTFPFFFSISVLPLLFHTSALPFLVLPYYHFGATCYFLPGTFSL